MYTLFSACMTASNSNRMNPEDRPSQLFYLSFHFRLVLVQQLHEEMQQKLEPFADANNTKWEDISRFISGCAELIKDEDLTESDKIVKAISGQIDALTKQNKDKKLRAIVERVISAVSKQFDTHLLSYLRDEDELFKSVEDCLPYRGEKWDEFADSKTKGAIKPDKLERYYRDNAKPAEGLNNLKRFKTVARRFTVAIEQAKEQSINQITVSGIREPQSMQMDRETKVFYATDRRKIDGMVNRCTLLYGYETVSIPPRHTKGKLETPIIPRGANEKKHVVVLGVNKIDSEAQFLEAIIKQGGHHVLLYIHGFKTSHKHAIRRAAQLRYDLGFQGVVLAYSWPSEGTYSGYFNDEVAVEKTAQNLRQVITTLLSEEVEGISEVHILAHSMGNRALITALTPGEGQKPPQQKSRFKNVILAAADEQHCKFEAMLKAMYPEDQNAIGSVPKRPVSPLISVYSSAEDWALIASETIHGEIRLGNTYSLLEMEGWKCEVDVVDASGVLCSGTQHSYHAEVSDVLDDIQYLLRNLKEAGHRAALRAPVISEVSSAGKRTFHAFSGPWWTTARLDQRTWPW